MSAFESNVNTSKPQLTDELWARVMGHVGLVDSTKNLLRVSKKFKKPYDQYLSFKNENGFDGHLIESSARPFLMMLDFGRYAVFGAGLGNLSPLGRAILGRTPDAQNVQHLRTQSVEDLYSLNSAMYTHWDKLGREEHGVVEAIEGTIKANQRVLGNWLPYIDKEVKYWKSSRINGDFYVVTCREDGAILVTPDCRKVFLVQGTTNSLKKAMRVKDYNTWVGMRITTTLLPWSDMVVYDSVVMVNAVDKPGLKLKKALFKAYVDAVDKGELITRLPKILPKAPPGKLEATDEIIAKYRLSLRIELDTLKRAKDSRFPLCWVFRRHGYTERENPHHLVAVMASGGMSGGMPVEFAHQLQKLQPTVEEVVKLLARLVVQKNDNTKPTLVQVDYLGIVAILEKLLDTSGIKCLYYPPPSKEEEHYNNAPIMGNPKSCQTCQSPERADGKPLLRCSRCNSVYYCSKECQKSDWRIHKRTCCV